MKRFVIAKLLLALWGAGVLFAGCADQESAGLDAARGPNCQTDSQCPGDQVCREGFCSVRSSETATLGFRFIPPNDSGFLPQHIRGVQVRAGDSLDFGLERSITVSSGASNNNEGGSSGGIFFAGSPLNGPSGTLVFRPADVDDQIATREASVDKGGFSAEITPGSYTLTFIPADRTKYPKKTWPEELFESNTYLQRTVPAMDDLIGVEGTLTREIAISGGTVESERVANARVYALARDGRASSTVVTTNESGDFRLAVAPNTGSYDIFVAPTSSNRNVVHAEFESAFEVGEDECVTRDGARGNPCRPTLPLGAYPGEPSPITATLEVPDSYSGEQTLAGTTVVVSATVAAGTYTRKHEVRAGEDAGEWKVDLELFPIAWSPSDFPRYTVEIIPPAASPFARSKAVLEGALGADAEPTLPVELKKRVSGQVLDSQGRPVSTVKLEFRAASDSQRDPRTSLVTTDENGAFEAWLEETSYEVLIAPPQGTGQPRTLTSATAAQIERGQLGFMLPNPVVLVGNVLGPRHADASEFAGLADVTVEAYEIIDGRMIVLGQSRTDADGEFRMAISSEL